MVYLLVAPSTDGSETRGLLPDFHRREVYSNASAVVRQQVRHSEPAATRPTPASSLQTEESFPKPCLIHLVPSDRKASELGFLPVLDTPATEFHPELR